MPSNNLWGDLPEVSDIRTPAGILREQATVLSELTKGVLRGKATFQQTSAGYFQVDLRVVAPALQNYEYTVLTITHPVHGYPVTVTADLGDKRARSHCANEEEFVEAVKSVLNADKTRTVVAALLAQSKLFGKAAG